MSETPSELDAFQKLLHAASISSAEDRPVLESDALVGPELGALLRRCAVPHDFDHALLQLLGKSDQETAAKRFDAFSELSVMQVAGESLSVHERWRRPLWAWWLRPEQRAEFVALSRTLADWFGTQAREDGTGIDSQCEIDARRKMFHLIGCQPDEGMRVFEALCRKARHSQAFSECSLLIRLVKEYEPALAPRERAVLAYHEGKLASDLNEWERACTAYRNVIAEPAAEDALKLKAMVRLGHAMLNLGQNEAALAELEQARDLSVTSAATANLSWRALYELGEVHRDLGNLDLAERTLRAALENASNSGEQTELAGVLSSLGTVQIRRGDLTQAIESFRLSLEHLERSGDVLRQGAVLNNLGLAQLEKTEWSAAESSFASSLERMRAAGDISGQATALYNSSRVQLAQNKLSAARKSAEQAGELYEAGNDPAYARALLQQARVADRTDEPAKAIELLQRTISRATQAGDTDVAASARADLVRIERRNRKRQSPRLLIIALGCVMILVVLIVAILMFVRMDFKRFWIPILSYDLTLTPNDTELLLARARAYEDNDQYGLATEDLEQIIKLKPESADTLNSLCWFRAIVGQLDVALANCNESLRIRPNDSNTLDSRAFVYLKIGKFDQAIANYDAALQIEPKKAASLYGRGIARLRIGDPVAAQTDIAAAKALKPAVVEQFTRFGVSP